jgi:hypothetical protein
MGVMEGESHSLTISEGVHWDHLSLQQTFVFITSTPNLRVLPGSSISSRVYLLPRDHVESESLGFSSQARPRAVHRISYHLNVGQQCQVPRYVLA